MVFLATLLIIYQILHRPVSPLTLLTHMLLFPPQQLNGTKKISLMWTSHGIHLQAPAEVTLTAQQAACKNTKPTPSVNPLPPPTQGFFLVSVKIKTFTGFVGTQLFSLQINRTFSFSLGSLRRKH